MRDTEADRLIDNLFTDKLEADTWLNFYKKVEKSSARAVTAQSDFNLAHVTENQIQALIG